LTFLKNLKNSFKKAIDCFRNRSKNNRPMISLLIPFSSSNPDRKANFDWLLKYWSHELSEAEVVIGESKGDIFCKGEALNDAARKSKGKILVILDADAYLSGDIITYCAIRMLEEEKNNLWYVPYRRLYRLTKSITEQITNSDPSNPYRPTLPIEDKDIENHDKIRYGNRYGAMIMMLSRKAYNFLGGFDERFKGWGGEDVCLLRALDTLYGKHKTIDADIFHLWHPFNGLNYEERRWDGQEKGGSNWNISKRYGRAINKPKEMKQLIKESKSYLKSKYKNGRSKNDIL
jgi:hypothetical protein